MQTILMDGKKLQQKYYQELRERIVSLKEKNIQPKLVVILVGDNAASKIYVHHKEKSCQNLGIVSEIIRLEAKTSFAELSKIVKQLNNDSSVHGILIQFPLPNHLNKYSIVSLIDPNKDADGLHPYNQGLNLTKEGVAPVACTPQGVMAFFKEYQIDLEGKNALIIGRSNIVGRPMNYLLTHANATVSTVHTKTSKSQFLLLAKNADIIVSAAGIANTITPDMVKSGVIIIDVGIIRDDNNKLRGDVDYHQFMNLASYITPVPGGVGPMTIAMLMANTIFCAEKLS